MQALGEYIVSVSAAAFVCAIAGSLMPKGPSREILKLVCGLFLAFTVIQPVSHMEIPELSELTEGLTAEGDSASAAGEEMMEQAIRESIKEQLEAYILDKAESLGLTVSAEIRLHPDTHYPKTVHLTGDAAPVLRQKLTEALSEDLDINQEDILWTGPD